MAEHQPRLVRDVYDHEHDESRPGRRRAVADWGVGEELFDHLPRRRFTRGSDGRVRERRPADRPERGAARDIPRGGADDGRRTIAIDKPDDVPSEIAALTADRDLGGVDDAHGGRAERGLSGVDDARGGRAERGSSGAGDVPAAVDWRADHGPPVRRTVTISGRPEGPQRTSRTATGPQRLQPPRTVAERMGAQPERLAAWAVALGLLLIVIAVITAG
jgi:hypothetical protein